MFDAYSYMAARYHHTTVIVNLIVCFSSGTIEEYDERKQLLTELAALMLEDELMAKEKKEQKQKQKIRKKKMVSWSVRWLWNV